MNFEQVLLQNLLKYYQEKKEVVEDKIKEWIQDMPFLKEMAYRALEGGKRFRGILTLLVCEALGGNLEEAVEFAAGIEFVHAATLLHDDVLDLHLTRRGKKSFWQIFNVHKAIITGDFIFTYAGFRVSQICEKALSILSRAIYRTTLGILLEAMPFSYPGPKYEVYLEVIKLKTGEMYAGATELGALCTRDASKMMYAYRYGLLLGEAYQIADDIYDLRILKNNGGSVDLKPIKLAIIYFEKLCDEEMVNLWKINDDATIISIAKDVALEEKLLNLLDVKIGEINRITEFFPDTKFRDFISYVPKYMIETMIHHG